MNATYDPLLKKARQLGMKLWDTSKLLSVLQRCLVLSPLSTATQSQNPTRILSNLLESERRFGATTERDPSQKRHDYHYFSKGSYFVLVEDIRQELATIAAHEYVVTRLSDGREKGSWPVPHCNPLSRGPFIEYNEKEERRREKQEALDREREVERVTEMRKLRQRQHARKNDLRRSVSMSNLRKQVNDDSALQDGGDFDALNIGPSHQHAPSGYLNSVSVATSGYVAASGNSVSITSNYGTTSTMGLGSSFLGTGTLPAPLRERLQNQVVTSRRVSALDRVRNGSISTIGADGSRQVSIEASASSAMMPPPLDVPDRVRLLRKSKSTNTLKLPKRDEKSKPGYCESCRTKFEDFKTVSAASFLVSLNLCTLMNKGAN